MSARKRRKSRKRAPLAVDDSARTQAAALAFLRDPKLIERITGDFERVGLVGEPSNALGGVSRLHQPQAQQSRLRC